MCFDALCLDAGGLSCLVYDLCAFVYHVFGVGRHGGGAFELFLFDLVKFFLGELEAERGGEAVEVAGDGLVEGGGGSVVEGGEVGVEDDLFAANNVNEGADVGEVNGDNLVFGRFGWFGQCRRFCFPMHEDIITHLLAKCKWLWWRD